MYSRFSQLSYSTLSMSLTKAIPLYLVYHNVNKVTLKQWKTI